ncbi:MAG: ABC transporter permease [Clostridia bacterium]|nr:ABC transporter permease [Clostridia bacterium]
MGKYILKRLVYLVLVFFLLTFLLFVIYQLMPANRAFTDAQTELKTYKNLTEEEKKTLFDELYLKYQRMYGTDTNNKLKLYGRWLGVVPFYDGTYKGMFTGYFGWSYEHSDEVVKVVAPHLKNSMIIGLITEIAVLGITIPLGIKQAVKKGSKFDHGVQLFSLIGFSTPSFITYIVFILLFCSILKIFPVSGMKTPGSSYTGMKNVLDVLYHVTLPTICLVFGSLAGITRVTRASMIDALSLDCVRTARAKGLNEKVVVYSHAWRNAIIPMVGIIVGGFFGIISGAMILETMFGFKGMGLLYLSSVRTADYDMIMFIQVIYTFIGLFSNLVTDLTYGIVDPRVRISK